MKNELIQLVENQSSKEGLPEFEVGDTVDVHQRILEGGKERVQIFSGTVIARKGEGIRETFTVRRIVQGEGVERIFPLHSPKLAKIISKRKGVTRRAKLYYLRDRVGKATKLPSARRPAAVPMAGPTARPAPAPNSPKGPRPSSG